MILYISSLCCVFLCSLPLGNGVGQFSLPSLPQQPAFKAAGITYDDGGMAPLFDFARSFIDTSLSAGFPTQLIDDMVNGNIVLDGDMIKQILLDYIGYAIAVVLGFLFVLLFPLIGCCFCCCRNCCRACCDRPKTVDPKASCKVKVYGSILFVIVAFTIAGNACVYVSNERITTALDKVTGTVNDNLDDFDLYLQSAEQQIVQIGANFHATTAEIDKQLDSTGFSQMLSEYAVSSLTGGAVQRLQDSAESANNSIDDINTELNNPTFRTAITMMQRVPGGAGIAVPTVPLPTVDTNLLNDITHQLKASVDGATTGIQTQLDDAKKQVSDMSTQVTSVVDGMKDTVQNVRNSNLDSIKDQVSDTVDTIKPFDHYRWIAGVVIGGIISLIVGLQFCGLGFGVCGSCGSPPDGPKGCMSNSGGRMIIASIIFIFLFAWLLMLLTTLLFAVGALTENFMCQPLKDPQLTDMETIMEDFVDIKTMLKYQQDPPSLGTILSSCKQNQAIYSALQMDKMGNLVDFPALEAQIKQAKVDMKTQLDTVLHSLSGGTFNTVNFSSIAVTTKLDNTKSAIENLDVDGIQSKITILKNKVDALASLPVLTSTQKQQMTVVTVSLDTILQKLVPLRSLKTSIGPLVSDVKVQLTKATTQIQGNGEMTRLSQKFINNTFDVVDLFYSSTKNAIYHDLGKCGPVWNLYNSIVIVSVCQYTVDGLNGFWFSLGWCIFFLVPSIVFGIKLSNLFRDMPRGVKEPRWNDRNKVRPRVP